MQHRCLNLLCAFIFLPPVNANAACNIVNGKAYGDCQNVTVRQGENAAIYVRSHTIENAIISGATVYAGGYLHLGGVCNGDINVKKGGQLFLTGVVNGTIRNEGGILEIDGIVSRVVSNGGKASVGGQVDTFSGNGPATFNKGAVLQGLSLERALLLPRTSLPAKVRTP